jgi:hypothetical protein
VRSCWCRHVLTRANILADSTTQRMTRSQPGRAQQRLPQILQSKAKSFTPGGRISSPGNLYFTWENPASACEISRESGALLPQKTDNSPTPAQLLTPASWSPPSRLCDLVPRAVTLFWLRPAGSHSFLTNLHVTLDQLYVEGLSFLSAPILLGQLGPNTGDGSCFRQATEFRRPICIVALLSSTGS